MPTPTKGPRLGGSPAHQKAILANLATGLFEHGAITTTEAKARRLRPFAEKLISKAKRGDLHNRRQVLSVIRDKSVVHVLFTEIGPRFIERPGGYTRITKLGPRKGDNAPMAMIELVQESAASTGRARTAPSVTAPSRAPARTAAPAGATTSDAAAPDSAARDTETEPTTVSATDSSASEGVGATAHDAISADETPAVEPVEGNATDATTTEPVEVDGTEAEATEATNPNADDTAVSDSAVTETETETEQPYGPGSAAPTETGETPVGYPIKGNADSMKFHQPGGQWFDQTEAEVWFATPEDAERAGFVEAGTHTDDA